MGGFSLNFSGKYDKIKTEFFYGFISFWNGPCVRRLDLMQGYVIFWLLFAVALGIVEATTPFSLWRYGFV